jgi:hypothetical protein
MSLRYHRDSHFNLLRKTTSARSWPASSCPHLSGDPFLFDKELNPSRLCHLELCDHLDSVYRSHGRDGQVTLM